ncbi:MAG: hypothetical protein Q8M11_18875 [Sulfuritalea sp.]|nr:hypothetical protein [Sulfuritalea sp.]MDP1983414.1 hypothetical protein [Sulfuritalea sp.]
MKFVAFLAVAAMLASQPVAARNPPRLPCADADKECAQRALKNHAAGRIATWQAMLALPVGERIGPAPPHLVEYLNLDNIVNGYAERPRAARLDAGLLADIRGAVADVPAEIWRLVGERLVGVYFVEGLGGTGYTDYVFDDRGKPVKGFVVLDAAVLARQRANAWATWKENTPFAPGAGYRLDARIEANANDNRRNAIQYILLHELGHVLTIGADIHPPWNIAPKHADAAAKYPFFDLSWAIDRPADKYRTLFDADFPQRASTVYYFGAKLAAADMTATYASLKLTNFPSLYAATAPGDDFAESFASFVHVVLLRRPWQITISRDGKPVEIFRACWGEPRCAEKQKMLEQLMRRGP